MEKLTVTENKEKNRFEANLGTDIAYIEYRYQGTTKVLMHTWVPEKYRGKGIAAKLIEEVLDTLQKSKKQVMINCAAVSRFLKDRSEFNDVVVRFRPVIHQQRVKKSA